MYGSTRRTAAAAAAAAAAGADDNAISTSQTPLISNQLRKHREDAAAQDDSMMPPPNYDHNRRMQDLKQQKAAAGSSSRRLLLGPRSGSVAVFKNVFADGSDDKAHHQHHQQHQRRLKEHRAKRNKQQEQQQQMQSVTSSPADENEEGGGVCDEKSNKKKGSKKHSFLYSMLNPYSCKWQATAYKALITMIISTDLIMFVASTDVRASTSIPQLFDTWEAVVSCVFLVEYVARFYVIIEKPKYGSKGPWLGRFYYALGSVGAWIDLLAAAPFFVERITGWSLPTLTVLRMFRLFRILKTQSYMRALDAVYRVVYYNSEILYVAALICLFLTVSTAMLLYVLRPEHDDENNFGSILATLYLSTMMLTGQGGPDGELPWYTKSVVLLTSVFSVAIFAIPASMLTWGFEAEAERMATAAYKKKTNSSSNNDSSTSSEGDTTDDEYFKLLAGGGDEDTDEEEAPWMKELRESFESADINHDGSLSLPEMIQMMSKQRQQPSPEMTARIDALEEKVKETNEKLDRILGLLQPEKQGVH